jgi:hypothetical protein
MSKEGKRDTHKLNDFFSFLFFSAVVMFIGVDFKNLIIHSKSFVLCVSQHRMWRGGGKGEEVEEVSRSEI